MHADLLPHFSSLLLESARSPYATRCHACGPTAPLLFLHTSLLGSLRASTQRRQCHASACMHACRPTLFLLTSLLGSLRASTNIAQAYIAAVPCMHAAPLPHSLPPPHLSEGPAQGLHVALMGSLRASTGRTAQAVPCMHAGRPTLFLLRTSLKGPLRASTGRTAQAVPCMHAGRPTLFFLRTSLKGPLRAST